MGTPAKSNEAGAKVVLSSMKPSVLWVFFVEDSVTEGKGIAIV
jgi:hypothetical protein